MARDDFSAETKRQLAQRAGYACSICGAITVGPSIEKETGVNLTGVAAHITSASKGFKRYDANLTPAQRSDIKNGIWLCNSHADLIDGDSEAFSTPYLHQLKHTHEQKIRFKQSGINVDKGIITSIEISNFGLFTDPTKWDFSERNIVMGNNGTGKTLILDLIASLVDKLKLQRWINERRKKINSFYKISYFKNQQETFTVSVDNNHRISYCYNESPIPILKPPLSIFYLKVSYQDFLKEIPEMEQRNRTLISLLAEYFQISEDELINILGMIKRSKKHFCNDLYLNEANDDLLVKYSSNPEGLTLPFRLLSGGEKDRVLLEITLKIADYFSKFNATVLLIEKTSFWSLDSGGVNQLFDFLRTENLNFQFFFTSIENRSYNMEGFTVHTL